MGFYRQRSLLPGLTAHLGQGRRGEACDVVQQCRCRAGAETAPEDIGEARDRFVVERRPHDE